jgi:hypothetical protein
MVRGGSAALDDNAKRLSFIRSQSGHRQPVPSIAATPSTHPLARSLAAADVAPPIGVIIIALWHRGWQSCTRSFIARARIALRYAP